MLVIITRPIFLKKSQDYARWKSQHGIITKVVTLDEISHFYSGFHSTDKIKSYINNESRESGANYFMLIGDAQLDQSYLYQNNFDAISQSMDDVSEPWLIPTACFIEDYWSKYYNRSLTIDNCADFFYADSRNWDPDNDGLYEDSDIRSNDSVKSPFNFTVYVSRIAVRNPDELDNIFNKFKNYQKADRVYSVLGDDAYNPLMYNYSNPQEIISNYPCDPIYGLDRMLNYTNLSHTQIRVPSQESNRSQMVSNLFNSRTIALESFHGSLGCIHPPSLSPVCSVESTEISPLLLTGSCYIDAFYMGQEDTLFEKLLKNESGPATIISNPMSVPLLIYLANGSTVGQAYYQALSNAGLETGGGTRSFFGDPTLVLFDHTGFNSSFNWSSEPVNHFGCYPNQ